MRLRAVGAWDRGRGAARRTFAPGGTIPSAATAILDWRPRDRISALSHVALEALSPYILQLKKCNIKFEYIASRSWILHNTKMPRTSKDCLSWFSLQLLSSVTFWYVSLRLVLVSSSSSTESCSTLTIPPISKCSCSSNCNKHQTLLATALCSNNKLFSLYYYHVVLNKIMHNK